MRLSSKKITAFILIAALGTDAAWARTSVPVSSVSISPRMSFVAFMDQALAPAGLISPASSYQPSKKIEETQRTTAQLRGGPGTATARKRDLRWRHLQRYAILHDVLVRLADAPEPFTLKSVKTIRSSKNTEKAVLDAVQELRHLGLVIVRDESLIVNSFLVDAFNESLVSREAMEQQLQELKIEIGRLTQIGKWQDASKVVDEMTRMSPTYVLPPTGTTSSSLLPAQARMNLALFATTAVLRLESLISPSHPSGPMATRIRLDLAEYRETTQPLQDRMVQPLTTGTAKPKKLPKSKNTQHFSSTFWRLVLYSLEPKVLLQIAEHLPFYEIHKGQGGNRYSAGGVAAKNIGKMFVRMYSGDGISFPKLAEKVGVGRGTVTTFDQDMINHVKHFTILTKQARRISALIGRGLIDEKISDFIAMLVNDTDKVARDFENLAAYGKTIRKVLKETPHLPRNRTKPSA